MDCAACIRDESDDCVHADVHDVIAFGDGMGVGWDVGTWDEIVGLVHAGWWLGSMPLGDRT